MGTHINQDALDQVLSLGGNELLLRLAKLFGETVPKRLNAAEQALRDGRIDDIHRELHSMRSSAGNLGAETLSSACLTIEQEIKDGHPTELESKLKHIRELHAFAHSELEAIANKG